MRISDSSSDVCSSDLLPRSLQPGLRRRLDRVQHQGDVPGRIGFERLRAVRQAPDRRRVHAAAPPRTLSPPHLDRGQPAVLLRRHRAQARAAARSEEHTSELQSLMRISYAVFCLKKKKRIQNENSDNTNE